MCWQPRKMHSTQVCYLQERGIKSNDAKKKQINVNNSLEKISCELEQIFIKLGTIKVALCILGHNKFGTIGLVVIQIRGVKIGETISLIEPTEDNLLID